MALAGIGSALNPWLITTMAEFLAVARDPSGSGHYRISSDLDTGAYHTLDPVINAIWGAKVIDGNGYTVRLAGNLAGSYHAAFLCVHLKNIKLHYRLNVSIASAVFYLNVYGSMTDCALYISRTGLALGNGYITVLTADTPAIIAKDFSRVALLGDINPSSIYTEFFNTYIVDVTPSHNYVYAVGTPGAGITKTAGPLTLALLDSASGGLFSANGWWENAPSLIPYQAEQVQLELQTKVDGANVSRMVWFESERVSKYAGTTDNSGVGQFYLRMRRGRSFVVHAAEDFGTDELRANCIVEAGSFYLPPVETGYVYQAGSSGRISSVAGVAFNSSPVTISGIIFTPRQKFGVTSSERLSVSRGGVTQALVLDRAATGGGGPVIEGDLAYLDGIVEEIHPFLGTVRPLDNSEVIAFERRASGFIVMGSAYSNALGEFRIGTDIYGGGDIFAFAADFPGVVWQAAATLSLGDRVRPTENNGYVYEIITAGNSGATEPAWWADAGDGTEGAIGSATAKARPYYQPVGHGPLKMTLVE